MEPIVYDPSDRETNAEPFPIFHRLQAEDPVHFSEKVGGWVVTRFADVQAGLKDLRLSSDRITPAMEALGPAELAEVGELGESLKCWSIFADPPTHTRLRNLFNKAFTPRAIAHLQGVIPELIERLLAPHLDAGKMEFISDFAYPLPALVICEMIGIPKSDIGRLQDWSDGIATFIGLPKKPWGSYLDAHRANSEMSAYFQGLVEDHRRHPREDLLSSLIEARNDGQRLTEQELIATCILLLFAAHTTTTHLLGNGLLALMRNRGELVRLTNTPTLVDSAVEELLRYDGPIQAVRRIALEPLTIGTRQIRTGELVFFMVNAANRDRERFPEPDALDIGRKDARHLGFGAAIHFCPGAGLARMEARAAFSALLERISSIEPDGNDFEWLESFGFRGLRRLPIRMTKRAT